MGKLSVTCLFSDVRGCRGGQWHSGVIFIKSCMGFIYRSRLYVQGSLSTLLASSARNRNITPQYHHSNPTHMPLPSQPCQNPLGPPPHRRLPRFIHQQKPDPKSHRQEKVLDRDGRGAEDTLQTRRVTEDEDDDEGEEDGGEEVEVLGGFVEGGRVLEDGEVAGAGGHEVEPLPGSGGLVRGGKDGERAKG